MKKIIVVLVSLFGIQNLLNAQYAEIYPSNWWVGMKWNKVQLLIKGDYDAFNQEKIRINYPGVKIEKVNKLDNGKYMSVDVSIAASTKPGEVIIEFVADGKAHATRWPLKARRQGKNAQFAQGVTQEDVVYLLMPDRFSNGDASNDKVQGMRDQSLNRDSVYHRHGGDFKGIINHLDYLKDLGITTLWMTPVLENDMPNRTEHGYSFTNHYKIEPRFGGAEMYKQLSSELHKRGMKLMQDAVYNHVGSYNITFIDQPTKDWYHQWPKFTQTSYKDQPLFDPYHSKKDMAITADGWFTKQMPDLNQGNIYVSNFLIQHALWSVEEFGVDGWRIDTYIYNDLNFMNKCNDALIAEYPKMTMFGETWVHGTASQAYFARNNINTPFKSNLIGVTDFQTLFYGILPAIKDKFGWTDGVNKLYTTLSNDFLYKDASNNCIFLDNHDLTRIATEFGGDANKVKMGLGWLLTSRGIPQIYYGTEVLMKGDKGINDGWVRLDFPGGWDGDAKNAFTQNGLNDEEKSLQDYTKKLANFRKKSTAIKTGKMMQYVPDDGLYVYFRYDEKQTVMCVMNTAENDKEIEFANYAERTKGFSNAMDAVSGVQYSNKFLVPKKQMLVLELMK
ncbi:MAG: cyclomaltodextrinase N-terminal domain-containing protein [Chitinophagaceae bacterium]|nr:cyclomaltodextrinase N-terminal domain-containing protein [Chitinophagaceae bacterium]